MKSPYPYLPASLRTFAESKKFGSVILAVVALLVLLVVFEAGAFFGYHEASVSYRWSENYARNFGGPSPSGNVMFVRTGQGMPEGHGAFGQISNLALPTFVLTDPNHPEERIRIESDTIIKKLNTTVSTDALANGTYVVVLGDPNSTGEIAAKLVRILPPPGMLPKTPLP